MATQEIKCAKCHVALQGPADPQPQDRFVCPRCGIGDSFENVMSEAGDYAAEQLARPLADGLRAAFRNSKNIKLTETPRPHKTHRFVIDLDLH